MEAEAFVPPRPPRANGRPTKARKNSVYPETDDPEYLLLRIMNDNTIEVKERRMAASKLADLRAAKQKPQDGKKGERKRDAEEVAAGNRFAPGRPPMRRVA